MMQDRVPSKVQVDKLLYMRLSLMNLVSFAYTSLYHSGSSEIKMEKKSPYLEISKNMIPNIHFKDKVIDKKSLKLIYFHPPKEPKNMQSKGGVYKLSMTITKWA